MVEETADPDPVVGDMMMGQGGKKSGRADCIVRAIRLVQMFQTQREVTVRQIMEEFDITKQSAQVWLDAMSLIYPVYEIREDRRICGSRNRVPPRPRKVFGILSTTEISTTKSIIKSI